MKRTALMVALLLCLPLAGPVRTARAAGYSQDDRADQDATSDRAGQGDKNDKGDRGDKKKEPLSAATFAGLKLRGIGPAFISGRVADLAVDSRHPSTYYVAAASGGLWKTVNAGTTFEPIFDGEGSYSLGCVTVDPNDSL
ncbi:MAG TPA: hypothetical protein VMW75_01255, partial [Thermoanaerobaculia bacterium]|nr:hypothetical protein [Thermoanaerobaculia bacterium]